MSGQNNKNWTLEDWKQVIWSDESKFNLLNSDGKEYYWTNNPGALTPDSVKPTKKYGGGCVMVWSCMTWHGLGFSCKIDNTMDGELYSEILKGELMNTIEYYDMDPLNVIFQHDNDPKHTSKVAKSTLSKLHLKTITWPSQSPNMNPIEHLWDYLDTELRKHTQAFSKKDEISLALENILKEKHVDYCQKLISTMPQRVSDLLKAKGGYTRW